MKQPIHPYSELQRKFFIIIVSFSLIPLLSLGTFVYFHFTKTYTTKVMNNLRTIVEDKKNAIDLFIEERISQMKTIAYTHSYEQLSNKEYLNNLLLIIQSASQSIIDIGIINQGGDHVAYAGPYSLEGLNYQNEIWFHEVIVKEVFVSDVFLGFRKYPHFIIAVARKEEGNFWILRATIDSDIFNSIVRDVQIGEKGDAYLLNINNILQTPSRFGKPVLAEGDFQLPSFFNGSVVKTYPMNSQNTIIGMAWLKKTNWLLVISEDSVEETTPLSQAHHVVIILVLTGMVLIITGTFMVAKSIIGELLRSDKEKALLDANLMQSSKMAALGKLAAGVAHEINNPLSLIKESAGWLKDLLNDEAPEKLINYAEYQKVASKIDSYVDRAKTVTHRMLGFARKFEPVYEDLDLNIVIDQTLSFLESEAIHRNILIEKDYLNKLPKISTDINQIQQVLLNVLDNAIDAIGKNGTIRLKTLFDENRKEIILTVSDTGKGIPKDEIGKIFDPFYTSKVTGEGTGLGLSISYNIMEKLGGSISVESVYGQGCTFTICFPVNK